MAAAAAAGLGFGIGLGLVKSAWVVANWAVAGDKFVGVFRRGSGEIGFEGAIDGLLIAEIALQAGDGIGKGLDAAIGVLFFSFALPLTTMSATARPMATIAKTIIGALSFIKSGCARLRFLASADVRLD